MRKFALTMGAMLALAGLTASVVVAAPQGKKAPAGKPGKPAEAPKCPVCKMTLSPKKTKENAVAVKIAGKTWYCCNKCSMKKAGGKKS